MIQDLWDRQAANSLPEGLPELAYRSRLLGTDRRVANWGGGNTSMKTIEKDFRGRGTLTLWVKGSGSDLGTMSENQFTALSLEPIRELISRASMTDEKMVEYLERCMTDSRRPRASIETLLHAFLPYRHIDHTHPDAIISLCCSENGREIAREIYGNRFVWVPYVRPGFEMSKLILEALQNNPDAELVLMAKHGLVTWGDSSEACYRSTISAIRQAELYIEEKARHAVLYGGSRHRALPAEERKRILTAILPYVRGLVGLDKRMILNYDDNDDVLAFVNGNESAQISQIGAACPDHLIHTKRLPLFVDWNPADGDIDGLKRRLRDDVEAYIAEYSAYFARNRVDGDTAYEASPRIILIPGIGMISTGRSRFHAMLSASLYHRAIAVMKGVSALGERFVSLDERESYGIEYWPLEVYKLSLAPPEAEFARQVVLITGAAGGIGSETARQFVREGAHVVLADLNEEGVQRLAEELNGSIGSGEAALAVKMDVTSEQDVRRAFDMAALRFGGIDIVVNNAGLATSSPFDETSLKEWQLNMDVLGTGYFLVAREAFRRMKEQQTGGCVVFVASKNAVYAGKGASAYSAAKALETHLARCLAAEGGEFGIRVNSVLPDAVLQGSGIFSSAWRNERAAAYGVQPEELEDYYRSRSALRLNVYPADVAEAVKFLASSKSAKTTGCMITVDAGVPAAFAR
ncbi:bifunctional aldolase/short-chain dehydrogenase [Cohnella hongkongensis]|uniref:Bifunctional aldolase/short-chain dehydrogenase n=1 Tax=Cohnella hongkongensis TaxID=178337 RepID=A0ABV9F9C4_9BACL